MDSLHNVPSLSEITHRDLRKTSTTHGMPMPGDDVTKPISWSKSEHVPPAKEIAMLPIARSASSSTRQSIQLSPANIVHAAKSSSKGPRSYTTPTALAAKEKPGLAAVHIQVEPRPSVYSGIETQEAEELKAAKKPIIDGQHVKSVQKSETTFVDPFAVAPSGGRSSALSRSAPPPRQRSIVSTASPRTEVFSPPTAKVDREVIRDMDHAMTLRGTRNLPVTKDTLNEDDLRARSRTLRINSQPNVRIIPGNQQKSMTGSLLSRGQSVRLVLLLSAMAVVLSITGKMGGGETSGRTTLAIGMIGLAGYITYESISDRRSEAALAASMPSRNVAKGTTPTRPARKRTPGAADPSEKLVAQETISPDPAAGEIVRGRLGSVEGITERTFSKDERMAEVMVRAGIDQVAMDKVYRPLFFAEFRDPWGIPIVDRVNALVQRLETRQMSPPENNGEKCEAIIDCARETFVDSLLNQRVGAYLNGQTIRLHYDPALKILEISIFLWEDYGDFDHDRAAWYKALASLDRIRGMLQAGDLPRVTPVSELAIELIFRPASTGSLKGADKTRFSNLGREAGISLEVVRALAEQTEASHRVRWLTDLLRATSPNRVAISYKPHRGWQRLKQGQEEWRPEEWSRLVPSAFYALAEAGQTYFKSDNPLEVLEIIDHLPLRWKPGEEEMGPFAFAAWSWGTLLINTTAGNATTNGEMFDRMLGSGTGIIQHFQKSTSGRRENRSKLILSAKNSTSIEPFKQALTTHIESTETSLTELSTLLNSDTNKHAKGPIQDQKQRDLFIRRAKLKNELDGLAGLKGSTWWVEEGQNRDEGVRKVWNE